MPLKYWDEAFLTATFLNNMLPSKVINNECPTERLLHITPNYDALRTSGVSFLATVLIIRVSSV
jgi:hypothetical protein